MEPQLHALGNSIAKLADRHRATLMAARTLLQQALPTTFGLKAA
jgi:3-carboxy-cis,cis-muconate cycloisomerase